MRAFIRRIVWTVVMAVAALGSPPSASAVDGIASWGWFDGHVVTRYPRGTKIEVCGPLACWRGRSWGYGPAAWTGRIVDLDRSVFATICGNPSRGLCKVTLERVRLSYVAKGGEVWDRRVR